MIDLTQQFTAHPVGQGLFYSGLVNIRSNNMHDSTFRFVFDCGSLNETNATEEVNLYRENDFRGPRLDLLVISHFDADHVKHIKPLLEDKKVDKVVLPFTTLEERLYLVLKHYDDGDTLTGPDLPVEFILDPIRSLSDNLDGDSTIYIVNSGPDNPFSPGDENISDIEPGFSESGSNNLSFNIEAENISQEIANQFGFNISADVDGTLRVFDDSQKGKLLFRNRGIAIMEFLFYRRNVGEDNGEFFKTLFKVFCEDRGLDPENLTVKELIDEVKKITSSPPIRDLIRKVKEDFTLSTPGRRIDNLNTTALAMLHYNLPAIYRLGNPNNYYIDKDITCIKKFDGTSNTRSNDTEYCIFPYRYGWHPEHPPKRFPNCLLTSDNFIKRPEEVEAFYQKYKNYWNLFWLFQVPHHGAATSSDLTLLTRLPGRLTKFINYGTTHDIGNWRHPSPQLINDLVASGQSTHVVPVNEFNGLEYGISYA